MENRPIYEWDIVGPECDEGIDSYEPDTFFHKFFKKLEDLTDDDWDMIDGFEYTLALVLKVGMGRRRAYVERDERTGDWVFTENGWVPEKFRMELRDHQRRYSWDDYHLRIHRERCCVEHGCWWLHDECPVVAQKIAQDGPCEKCEGEKVKISL